MENNKSVSANITKIFQNLLHFINNSPKNLLNSFNLFILNELTFFPKDVIKHILCFKKELDIETLKNSSPFTPYLYQICNIGDIDMQSNKSLMGFIISLKMLQITLGSIANSPYDHIELNESNNKCFCCWKEKCLHIINNVLICSKCRKMLTTKAKGMCLRENIKIGSVSKIVDVVNDHIDLIPEYYQYANPTPIKPPMIVIKN